MTWYEDEHYVFFHSSSTRYIYFVVYVDDNVIISDDETRVWHLKKPLSQPFHTKDLRPLKYFLGIEVAQSSSSIVINQHKYVVNILTETNMFDYQSCDTLLDPNIKLLPRQGEPLKD